MYFTVTTKQARTASHLLKSGLQSGGIIVKRINGSVQIGIDSFIENCDCHKCTAIKSVLQEFLNDNHR